MKARLHDLSLARDGGYLLTIATRENVGALYDELRETDVDVTVKKHREKRSLDANAYAWVLMDKLAEATGTPTSEVYRQAVKDVGGNTETVCVREKAVQKLCGGWNKNGIGWQTEVMDSKIDGCKNVVLYYGSSTFDTNQMSRLIDNIVQDCKAVGIEPLTPQQLDALKEDWRCTKCQRPRPSPKASRRPYTSATAGAASSAGGTTESL